MPPPADAEPRSASANLAADGAGEGRIGEPEAAHLRLALEGDPRGFVGQGAVRDRAEARRDMVERSFCDMNLLRVEVAFDGGAGRAVRRSKR